MSKPQLLYLEIPGFANLPSRDILKIIGHGAEVQAVSDEAAALSILNASTPIDVLIANAPVLNVFEFARAHTHRPTSILVTDLPMDLYSVKLSNREELLLDHIVAYRNRGDWTLDDLRITVQKILQNDLFGLEKYLIQGTKVREIKVRSSSEREIYNNEIMQFAEECRLGTHLTKAVWGISEEMLMNAIYDAPAAAGISRFIDVPRTAKLELEPHEQAKLRYACDGEIFALSISDPFGLLTQQKLFEYLKKVLRRTDSSSIIDTKKGGAGLGLFKILYSCHGLICNVERGKRTEFIALVDIQEQIRDFAKMTRSIHFFNLI